MEKTPFAFSTTNVMVEFRILGENFVPEQITQKLSISPDEFWLKGEPIKGRDILRQYTCWILSTGYEESLDINEQLNKILERLTNKKELLHEIKAMSKVTYRIDIVINIENGQKPAIFLGNSIIEFAHSIGAEFDFDLYIYS